jgi:ArsR family transcriptional regulator
MDRFFRALADNTRLRVLNLLGEDEVCVCFLVEILQTTQPNISRHLAYLRRAGIVAARRDGKWMNYRITSPPDPCAADILSGVMAWLAQDKKMQQDRKRLVNVCCSPEAPLTCSTASRHPSSDIL